MKRTDVVGGEGEEGKRRELQTKRKSLEALASAHFARASGRSWSLGYLRFVVELLPRFRHRHRTDLDLLPRTHCCPRAALETTRPTRSRNHSSEAFKGITRSRLRGACVTQDKLI